MVITYYGTSCFKAQSGDYVIAFDPPSKKSGLKTPRFQTDVVCISHNHELHNGKDELAGREKNLSPFTVTAPGEYEIREVMINGISSFHDTLEGQVEGINTIYVVTFEGMRICHLGDFGETSLRPETKEAIGAVDILMVPIGGGTVIDPSSASRITTAISPHFIIPMHYDVKNQKKGGSLKLFFEELGSEPVKATERFSVKKKDIEESDGAVVVLEPMLT